MAEGAKDVIQTKRMDRANVEMAIIVWSEMNLKPILDLVNGYVRVGNAGDVPTTAPQVI